MKTPPHILVQLVHIQGPMKGEIQEFADPTIRIGRNPSGHVHFPKDMTIISRDHAEITREGNRYRLMDHSTNGTFVNGKRIQEAYLKDGDVLTFAEGGPKVSFLTKITEGQPAMPTTPEPAEHPEMVGIPPDMPAAPPPRPAEKSMVRPDPQRQMRRPQGLPRSSGPSQPLADQFSVQPIQAPLVIQYGPTLRSFKQVPVTVGKNPACEFVLDHHAIMDQHAQIFFHQDQYWIKDLTGRHMLSINGRPVDGQSPMVPNDILEFSPNGPNFRFLGGGRLAEIEEPEPEQFAPAAREKQRSPQQDERAGKGLKGAKAIFDKFLRR